METVDVLVVGLGPAGAVAAGAAARAGARVLALDRRPFPRYKPCGGCVSAKADPLAAEELHEGEEEVITGATLAFASEELSFCAGRPIARMVMRETFDDLLARSAGRAGAEVRFGERALGLVVGKESVIVRTDRGLYAARAVIGADGPWSAVARHAGLWPRRRPLLWALEAEYARRPGDLPAEHLRIRIGGIPGGYGWVFPKERFLSAGIVGRWRGRAMLREAFAAFASQEPSLRGRAPERDQGHPIPLNPGAREPLGRGRVLLAGDAAGLVDPFLYEGIYYALQSGLWAGEAAVRIARGDSGALRDYQRTVRRSFGGEFRAAQRAARLIYRHPGAGVAALRRSPGLSALYMDVIAGARSYRDLVDAGRGVVGGLIAGKISSLFRGISPGPLEEGRGVEGGRPGGGERTP